MLLLSLIKNTCDCLHVFLLYIFYNIIYYALFKESLPTSSNKSGFLFLKKLSCETDVSILMETFHHLLLTIFYIRTIEEEEEEPYVKL